MDTPPKIQEVEEQIIKLQEAMRKIAPDGRPRIADRPAYNKLYRQMALKEEQLKLLRSKISSPFPGERGHLKKEILPFNKGQDTVNAQFLEQNASLVIRSLQSRLNLADDLERLLNNVKISELLLHYLQQQNGGLDLFSVHYLLLEFPTEKHRKILKQAIELTPSNYVAACKNKKLLEELIWLTVEEADTRCSDLVPLLQILIVSHNSFVKSFVKTNTVSGKLSDDWIISTIKQLVEQEYVTTDEVINFAKLVTKVHISPSLARTFLRYLLLGTIDDLVHEAETLEKLLLKARTFQERALLSYSRPVFGKKNITVFITIASRIPKFANWFVYEELVHLENDEQFGVYMRQITSGLRKANIEDERLRPALQALVNYEWESGSLKLLTGPAKAVEHIEEDDALRKRIMQIALKKSEDVLGRVEKEGRV